MSGVRGQRSQQNIFTHRSDNKSQTLADFPSTAAICFSQTFRTFSSTPCSRHEASERSELTTKHKTQHGPLLLSPEESGTRQHSERSVENDEVTSSRELFVLSRHACEPKYGCSYRYKSYSVYRHEEQQVLTIKEPEHEHVTSVFRILFLFDSAQTQHTDKNITSLMFR